MRKWIRRLSLTVTEGEQGEIAGPAAPRVGLGPDGLAGSLLLIALILPFWLVQVVVESPKKALDAFEFHYPSYLWTYSQIAGGTLPLWNPFQLCGIPTLATLQIGVLYPPHLLYALLPTGIGMAASGLLHLLLVGISTLTFALRIRLGLPAALLAAILVSMRGAQPGHVINPSMQEAGAWLVVGLLGVLDLAGRARLRGVLLLALATGMGLLAGFPQYAVYSAYTWAFVLFALLMLDPEARPGWRPALMGAAAAIALGVAIAGIALIPALELSEVGGRQRGLLSLDQMLHYGGAGFETLARGLRTALTSRPALPGLALGFGIVGLLLVPLAFVHRARRRLAIVFSTLGILTLLIAAGPSTPIFDLYLLLPEVGSFRNPWRILYITDFCFAIVAAIGLDALLRRLVAFAPDTKARRGATIAVIAAVLVLTIAVAEIFAASPGRMALPYDRESALLRPYHEQRAVLTRLAASSDRVWTWLLGDMGDVSEKLASVFGIRSISDIEIMTLRRQREYFSYLYWGEIEPSARNRKGHSQSIFYGSYSIEAPDIEVSGVVARSRLSEIAAARYLLVPRSAVSSPAVNRYLREKGLAPVDVSDRQIVLFEQKRALPRVYLSHRVTSAPEPEVLLAALSRSDFDPRAESYVEASPSDLPRLEPLRGDEHVRIARDELHEVEIEAQLGSRGLLVLADSFYPGWIAEVDGEATPILATNHLFRGVVVEAGRHRVVFRYRPRSVRLGAALSGLALAVMIALALRVWRSRR